MTWLRLCCGGGVPDDAQKGQAIAAEAQPAQAQPAAPPRELTQDKGSGEPAGEWPVSALSQQNGSVQSFLDLNAVPSQLPSPWRPDQAPVLGLGLRQLFGEVALQDFLGAGASGAKVYKATWRGSVVAVKLMVSSDPDQLRLTTREALLSRSLSHPHLVQTYAISLAQLTEQDLRLDAYAPAAAPDTLRPSVGYGEGGGADAAVDALLATALLSTQPAEDARASSVGTIMFATVSVRDTAPGMFPVDEGGAVGGSGGLGSAGCNLASSPTGRSGGVPGAGAGGGGGGARAQSGSPLRFSRRSKGVAASRHPPGLPPAAEGADGETGSAILRCAAEAAAAAADARGSCGGAGAGPDGVALLGGGCPLRLLPMVPSEPPGCGRADRRWRHEASGARLPPRHRNDTGAGGASSGRSGGLCSGPGAAAGGGGAGGGGGGGERAGASASAARFLEELAALGAAPGKTVTVVVMELCEQGTLLTYIHRRAAEAAASDPDASSRLSGPGSGPLSSRGRSLLPGIAAGHWSRVPQPLTPAVPAPAPPGEGRAGCRVVASLEALRNALEVAQAMAHLHSLDLVHGDLKPANVLLRAAATDVDTPLGPPECPRASRGYVCKVADFGLTNPVESAEGLPRETNGRGWGALAYLAPELVTGGKRGKPADVYSYGALLWHMATGQAPHASLHPAQILVGLASGELALEWPEGADRTLRKIGAACLAHDPANRPSFERIVRALLKAVRRTTDRLLLLQGRPASRPTSHPGPAPMKSSSRSSGLEASCSSPAAAAPAAAMAWAPLALLLPPVAPLPMTMAGMGGGGGSGMGMAASRASTPGACTAGSAASSEMSTATLSSHVQVHVQGPMHMHMQMQIPMHMHAHMRTRSLTDPPAMRPESAARAEAVGLTQSGRGSAPAMAATAAAEVEQARAVSAVAAEEGGQGPGAAAAGVGLLSEPAQGDSAAPSSGWSTGGGI
ncbi:hypothetical protein HYH03_015397 [Edaphochlamys debaryana]|uniref:Protein kinase domain-containing protein n=1 Tax=Edaphochlamys debaryana TaxID=47281 RepID=A0A836BSN3_9CHLO|nr:hypothetical protein HYH03_015397 [Edaphochlamys debaryana]|eukprot:KAG2485953.1 hypothetical protein HYH03_015397 [Edaphochlamys debaryana]